MSIRPRPDRSCRGDDWFSAATRSKPRGGDRHRSLFSSRRLGNSLPCPHVLEKCSATLGSPVWPACTSGVHTCACRCTSEALPQPPAGALVPLAAAPSSLAWQLANCISQIPSPCSSCCLIAMEPKMGQRPLLSPRLPAPPFLPAASEVLIPSMADGKSRLRQPIPGVLSALAACLPWVTQSSGQRLFFQLQGSQFSPFSLCLSVFLFHHFCNSFSHPAHSYGNSECGFFTCARSCLVPGGVSGYQYSLSGNARERP